MVMNEQNAGVLTFLGHSLGKKQG